MFEIAGGIILAVIVLAFWPFFLVAGAIGLVAAAIGAGVLVLIATLGAENALEWVLAIGWMGFLAYLLGLGVRWFFSPIDRPR